MYSWSDSLSIAFIVSVVPTIIAIARRQALRGVPDGKLFRSDSRKLYTFCLLMGVFVASYGIAELLWPSENFDHDFVRWVMVGSGLFLTVSAIWNSPGKVLVEEEGFTYSRPFRPKRNIRWQQVEDAAVSSDGPLYIYLKDGTELQLDEFTPGRQQLKDLLRQRMRKFTMQ